jgi:hypothetical protein
VYDNAQIQYAMHRLKAGRFSFLKHPLTEHNPGKKFIEKKGVG